MSLDDYARDGNDPSSDLQIGDIPRIGLNSPPGPFTTWSKYEPYEYDNEISDLNTVGAIGDCDIEGSEKAAMMVLGPPGCSAEKVIKSDFFVPLEDLQE